MAVHLVNPTNHTFGIATITPRWLFVLAAATPADFGTPVLIDETLKRLDFNSIHAGDVVGISIHTGNALRGYEIGREARRRGATVIFGGVHATLYPEESFEVGSAHAVVKGDGDVMWPQALRDVQRGSLGRIYEGGRLPAESFARARWDLLPEGRYFLPSIQTVRGCPKHCSFCSVWRMDGQYPRQRHQDAVLDELVELRRRGFRFVMFADDNFYPVTLSDLTENTPRPKGLDLAAMTAIREERLQFMERLASLPGDMMFFTQITMEAAEDPEFLVAMQKARIGAVLIGIESVSSQGLAAVKKTFNSTGDELVERLQAFKRHNIFVLGSFIFGLPSDGPDVADATLDVADKGGLPFAQFLMLAPFPGSVDFMVWEKKIGDANVDGIPLSRYWMIPISRRPRSFNQDRALAAATQGHARHAWTQFYSLRRIWRRSTVARTLRARLMFVLISKLFIHMYFHGGVATDSARFVRSAWIVRQCAAIGRRLFMADPMPELKIPARTSQAHSLLQIVASDGTSAAQ
jgi:radical SAM superfamily enzyme YgiQ (UPF0313 family)